jgi:hypothetical protein
MIFAPIPAAKVHTPAVFTKSRLEISFTFFSTVIVFLLIGLKTPLLWNCTHLFKEVKEEKPQIQKNTRQDLLFDQRHKMTSVEVKVVLPKTGRISLILKGGIELVKYFFV